MTNWPFIEQKRARLLEFVAEQADSWPVKDPCKLHGGTTRPAPRTFFRLVFRRDKKQESVYMGSDRDLAAEVQAAVRQLQVAWQPC